MRVLGGSCSDKRIKCKQVVGENGRTSEDVDLVHSYALDEDIKATDVHSIGYAVTLSKC